MPKMREYRFYIPDYQEYSEEELRNVFENTTDRLIEELRGLDTGVYYRIKRLTSLCIKYTFILDEIERRHPGMLRDVDQDIQITSMLEKLNINRSEDGQD